MANPTNAQLVSASLIVRLAEHIKLVALSIADQKHAGRVGKRRGSIIVGRPKVTRGEITISLSFSKDKRRGAPEAAAYEWGSGVHATRGASGKYTILPVTKRALWFPYPEAKIYPKAVKYKIKYKRIGVLGITTEKVEHPGVAPRPFLVPALQTTRPKVLRDIQDEVTENTKKFLISIKRKV